MASGDDLRMRMVPIAWRHAPSPRRPSRNAPDNEWVSYRAACRDQSLGVVATTELQRLRSWMDEHGQQERPMWCIVDGGYTNQSVLKHLPARTVLVGRVRADAKLYFLPLPAERNRGRRRVYGSRAPTPNQLRQDDSVPWQRVSVRIGDQLHDLRAKVLGPLKWRPAGEQLTLQLLVLAPLNYRINRSGKYLYRSPAYLVSTDPNASAAEIIQRYIYRWDIEVNFRDEKTLLGVGEAQVREEHAVENVTATAVAAYALLLAAAKDLNPSRDLSLPRPRWQGRRPARASTRQLIQQMRFDLWGRAMNFSGFVSPHEQTRSPRNDLANPLHAVMQASRFS